MGWVGCTKGERERERETKKKLWVQGLCCVHSTGVLASANCCLLKSSYARAKRACGL